MAGAGGKVVVVAEVVAVVFVVEAVVMTVDGRGTVTFGPFVVAWVVGVEIVWLVVFADAEEELSVLTSV